VGVPGVTLKVSEPYLYSNNQILESRAFERIYSKQDGYRGYFNAGNYMATANDEVYIPEDKFWAMGDNSANSLDSRYWKYVPRQNLVGTAFIVYWPITSRWGFIQ
jgi:signal peptidase I